MSQALTIRVRREPQYAIPTAVGEIDIATMSQLREQLFALAGDGRHRLGPRHRLRRRELPGGGRLTSALPPAPAPAP